MRVPSHIWKEAFRSTHWNQYTESFDDFNYTIDSFCKLILRTVVRFFNFSNERPLIFRHLVQKVWKLLNECSSIDVEHKMVLSRQANPLRYGIDGSSCIKTGQKPKSTWKRLPDDRSLGCRRFISRLFRHRKVKFKMVRERNRLLLLVRICVDISKMPVDWDYRISLTWWWPIMVSVKLAGFEYSQSITVCLDHFSYYGTDIWLQSIQHYAWTKYIGK